MNCWSVLGLPAGRDTAAIKKAYVIKLRTTRPDDDAAAYQRLREAFDTAMAYAKRAPQVAAPEAPWQMDVVPQRDARPSAPERAQDAPQTAAPQPQVAKIDLAELVKTTLDLWEKQGIAAPLAHWPQLEKVLGEVPLVQAVACSTAFAKMVLKEPKLPVEFVDQLRRFFGWGTDYRRTPQLAGHDVVEFKIRLTHVMHQLESKKLKDEQDRIEAIEKARLASEAEEELARATEAAQESPQTAAPQPQWHDAAPQPQRAKIDLGALVKATLDLWKKQGMPALLDHWPQLGKAFCEIPFEQAVACSTAFAKMVLDEPKLPVEFVDQLRRFFGWGTDYRRAPQLVGHDAVEFKIRLAQLVHQLESEKLKDEQERIDAIKKARRAREAEEKLALATRTRRAMEDAQAAARTAAPQAEVATVDIGALVKATLDLWEQQGITALLEHWPQLKKVLGDIPFEQAVACSTAFAKMVLKEPKLPVDFVDQLRRFFGWGTDYRRMPQLTGHDGVEFKRRLAQVVQQLNSQKLKDEQDRLQAIERARLAREAEEELARVTRTNLGHLSRFARMAPRTGALYAMLAGRVLQEQWSSLRRDQRDILGIDDGAFYDGAASCGKGMRLRSLSVLALMLIGLGCQLLTGSFQLYALPAIFALWLCYQFPAFQWRGNQAVIPVMVFCMAAWLASGMTDWFSVLIMSIFWCAAAHAMFTRVPELVVGLTSALSAVAVYLYWLDIGQEPSIEPLAMITPWIIFVLARRETWGFAIGAIAVGVLTQPFSDAGMLGVWVGAVAVAAGCVSPLTTWAGARLLERSVAL